MVSHDRHLLRATTDQFIIVADGELKPFDGDLDDYKDWLLQNKLAALEAAKTATSPITASTKSSTETATTVSAATKITPAQRKTLETNISKLDEKIAKLTDEAHALSTRLADSALYDDAHKNELKTLLSQQTSILKQLESNESEWLALNEQLEN